MSTAGYKRDKCLMGVRKREKCPLEKETKYFLDG
jgi:hypothetical protein